MIHDHDLPVCALVDHGSFQGWITEFDDTMVQITDVTSAITLADNGMSDKEIVCLYGVNLYTGEGLAHIFEDIWTRIHVCHYQFEEAA